MRANPEWDMDFEVRYPGRGIGAFPAGRGRYGGKRASIFCIWCGFLYTQRFAIYEYVQRMDTLGNRPDFDFNG